MGTPTRTRTRDAASAIIIVLALGLAFRVILAYQLPGSGFANDLASFQGWASDLATNGIFGFYDRPGFHDYTPGYLYVLWIVGVVGSLLGGIGDLIKIPAILADLAVAWLVWSMVQELGGSRRAALIGAAIVVVNPITWFDSVVWGQVDSVGVIFLLLAVRELWRDRPERSAILAVVAAIIKPQLGILVPIVAAVTISRAFWPERTEGPERTDGEERLPEGRTTLDWERRTRGPLRIVTTGLAGFLTAIALSAPFGLSLVGLVAQIFSTAAGYPYISVNAWNPWALFEVDGIGVAANGGWVCDAVFRATSDGAPDCATGLMFGPIPAVLVGTIALLAIAVAVSLIVARRPDRLTILTGVIVLAVAFFVVPTRVHERYLFPFFALAAIPAAVSLRWRLAYVVVSAATFANMYVVLTTLYPDNPSISDWLGIGGTLRGSFWVTVVALVHAAALAWTAIQLRASATRGLADAFETVGIGAGGEREPADQPTDAPGDGDEGDRAPERAPAPVPGAATGPAVGAAFASAPAVAVVEATHRGSGFPDWRPRPTLAELGPWGWFRARLADPPVRPDRTATLHAERGGRFDRLDVWVLAVLVVASLTVRMWRLDAPAQMHFDEVYHARTATEFLQDWRYGISHDIYEWTHPHLAKYAMAGGLVVFGNDRVTATGDLGVPVRQAAIEKRWDDPTRPGSHNGDRLHVATGSEVRSYDLVSRRLAAVTPLAGAAAIAVDPTEHRLIVGTESGELVAIPTDELDGRTAADQGPAAAPQPIASLGAPVAQIHVTGDGAWIVAATTDGKVASVDALTGDVTGTVDAPSVAQIADAGRGSALVVTDGVTDPVAVSTELASLVGGDAASWRSKLEAATDGMAVAPVTAANRSDVDTAIADGKLPGLQVENVPRVAVADAAGLTLILPSTGARSGEIAMDGGALGVAEITGVDQPKLYASTDGSNGPAFRVINLGDNGDEANPAITQTFRMPSTPGPIVYDEASQHVHILGDAPGATAPDATSAGGQKTVYVVEPHANAVYADARLPFAPVTWAMDDNQLYPASDRQDLLLLDAQGAQASVDVGMHEFAWRVPGVLAGVAMCALIYLLARILFRRRSIAVIAGLLTLVDGMIFVQSRIAMNDAYVGLFIIAAYVLFAALWTGRWRWRGAFWVAMPAIGVLLGLALASKWVAAYAIGALGILILARSALGRLVLIAGMIVVTTVLGYIAIAVPDGGNLTFALIMIALTLTAVVVSVLHPIAWSDDEMRFAIGAPIAAAVLVALVTLPLGAVDRAFAVGSVSITPLHVAVALAGLGVLVAVAFWLAGRWGFGPLAAPPAPDDPAALLEPPAPTAAGWLRPGWLLGLPVAWMVGSLVAIPLAVYVISYIPWAWVENHQLFPGWPPGHTGQTLLALTAEMYRYHNTLSSAHAASSPWWAWPFDLKPVWFYQESFAGGTAASVYDAGNLAIWWIGVPAMAFAAWQAFKRRSLGLALITIAFACQWVAWARIDRAAFQYHYYTSLPFVILALAYFVAELWHGASRRTWLLARLSAAAAIVAPAALWLLHRPLCGFVRVEAVNPGSQACPTQIPEFVLTARTAALALVVGVVVVLLIRQVLRMGRPGGTTSWDAALVDDTGAARPTGHAGTDRGNGHGAGLISTFAPLAVAAGVGLLGVLAVMLWFADVQVIRVDSVPVEPIALLVGIPLALVAAFVATARDARRFVIGLLTAFVAVFVVWYPNLAALPLPAPIVNMYQGLLPTYVYPFQFPVSTVNRTGPGPALLAPEPAILLAALTVASVVLAYSAWVWRIALAERRAGVGTGGADGSAFAGTGAGRP